MPRPTYIRFESLERCDDSASRLGIFQIAYRVRDAHRTSVHDANEIARHLEWLKEHLHSPDALDRHENRRAICWFRDGATDPIRRMWAIRPYLEAYGYWIETRTCWDPGKIVYADEWQVTAIPYRT